MPEVTCPQCRTRQPIPEDAHGYRCVACAASWSFVRCTVCGERFHTRPKSRAWTCPNCGTPHGRNRRGISRSGASLPLMIGAVVAVIAVVAVAQALGGDGDGDTATPAPTTTPTQVADPFEHVCQTLSEALQVFRVDQLRRAADSLEEDAASLRELGERPSAKAVKDMIAAIREYEEVAEGGGDTQAATYELLQAREGIDWCS